MNCMTIIMRDMLQEFEIVIDMCKIFRVGMCVYREVYYGAVSVWSLFQSHIS